MISPECRDEYGAEQRMVSTMLTRYVYVQISIASHNPPHSSPHLPEFPKPTPLSHSYPPTAPLTAFPALTNIANTNAKPPT